jgi:hypothetical protein
MDGWKELARFANSDLNRDETAIRRARALVVALGMPPSAATRKTIEELRQIQPSVKMILTGQSSRRELALRGRLEERDRRILVVPRREEMNAVQGIDALMDHVERMRTERHRVEKSGLIWTRISAEMSKNGWITAPQKACYEKHASRRFTCLFDIIKAFVLEHDPLPIRACGRPNCLRLFVRRFRRDFCSDACRYKAKARSRSEMRTYQYEREARILLREKGARALEEKISAVQLRKIDYKRKRWQIKVLRSVLHEMSH